MDNQIDRQRRREQQRLLYDYVNDLYESAQQLCEGVYFEIFVKPQEPISCIAKKLVLNLVESNDKYGDQHVDGLDDNPELKERLWKAERLHDDFKLLVDTAYGVYEELKKQYKDNNCVILIQKRKLLVQMEPRLEVNFEDENFNIDEEFGGQLQEDLDFDEDNSDFDSDEESDSYTDDSGIDPEIDVEPDYSDDSVEDWESDVDSGLQTNTDTDTQSEFEEEEEEPNVEEDM